MAFVDDFTEIRMHVYTHLNIIILTLGNNIMRM